MGSADSPATVAIVSAFGHPHTHRLNLKPFLWPSLDAIKPSRQTLALRAHPALQMELTDD